MNILKRLRDRRHPTGPRGAAGDEREETERRLDEALAATFPASDPYGFSLR